VYLHALVRDKDGQKMSKSKGNVIDPLEMVDKYSADALRFTLAILAVQGRDIKLSDEKLELSRNFTNKLYNATKYLLMSQNRFEDLDKIEIKTELGKYMLYRFNEAVKKVRSELDEYRFNDASMTLYRFLWQDFCDWGIELSKADKESVSELGAIYKESMKLLHPFMPFITEYLYQTLNKSDLAINDSIMIMDYPEVKEVQKVEEFDIIIEAITSIRRAKALIEMPNQRINKAFVLANLPVWALAYIEKLAKVENIELTDSKVENAVSDISDNLQTFIPLSDIDLTPIINRLEKQKEKLLKDKTKLDNMLSNEKFVANAPKEVVAKNKNELNEINTKLESIESELDKLKG
jgi:valyl-tRNA synthetase